MQLMSSLSIAYSDKRKTCLMADRGMQLTEEHDPETDRGSNLSVA